MALGNTLTVNNLRSMLRESSRAQFIDVRDPMDFAAEHVEGFENIPLAQLPAAAIRKLDNKRPLILICTNGKKAHLASNIMIESGFNDVRVVAGGLLSWKVQCFPLKTAV